MYFRLPYSLTLPCVDARGIPIVLQLTELVGEGGFGKVYKATSAGKEYAVKFAISGGTINTTEATYLELAQIRVLYHGILDGRSALVFEYFPGVELNSPQYRKISLDQALSLCFNLVSQVYSLHTQHHLIHVDIKSSNIRVVPSSNKIWLIDLGLATEVSDTFTSDNTMSFPRGRSLNPSYFAPEVIRGQLGYKSDVYMLTRVLEKLLGAASGSHDIRRDFPTIEGIDIRQTVATFLSRMKHREYAQRPAMEFVVKFLVLLRTVIKRHTDSRRAPGGVINELAMLVFLSHSLSAKFTVVRIQDIFSSDAVSTHVISLIKASQLTEENFNRIVKLNSDTTSPLSRLINKYPTLTSLLLRSDTFINLISELDSRGLIDASSLGALTALSERDAGTLTSLVKANSGAFKFYLKYQRHNSRILSLILNSPDFVTLVLTLEQNNLLTVELLQAIMQQPTNLYNSFNSDLHSLLPLLKRLATKNLLSTTNFVKILTGIHLRKTLIIFKAETKINMAIIDILFNLSNTAIPDNFVIVCFMENRSSAKLLQKLFEARQISEAEFKQCFLNPNLTRAIKRIREHHSTTEENLKRLIQLDRTEPQRLDLVANQATRQNLHFLLASQHITYFLLTPLMLTQKISTYTLYQIYQIITEFEQQTNTLQPLFPGNFLAVKKQFEDRCMQAFTNEYHRVYQAKFFTNPWSGMHRRLRNQPPITLAELRTYQTQNTQSRSTEIFQRLFIQNNQ